MSTNNADLITDSAIVNDRIADLGFTKQYTHELFQLLAMNKSVSPEASLKIKEACKSLREAWIGLRRAIGRY